jgi:predicted small lipoprotein YifL
MRKIIAGLIAAIFLVGCGQKGPLYLPSDKPPPRTPPASAPQQATDPDQKRSSP